MVDLKDQFEYVGFWRRVGAAFLDLLIFSPALIAYFYFDVLGFAFRSHSIWPYFLHSLVYFLPSAYCVVRFGGTPGKLILGMQVVGAGGSFLNLTSAMRRDSIGYASLLVTTALMWNAMMSLPSALIPGTSAQALDAMDRYGGWLNHLDTLLLILTFVDLLAVALNRRKRALHDFIAGSFVITKRSYDAIHSPRHTTSDTPATGPAESASA